MMRSFPVLVRDTVLARWHVSGTPSIMISKNMMYSGRVKYQMTSHVGRHSARGGLQVRKAGDC